jgi:hypothetical protein
MRDGRHSPRCAAGLEIAWFRLDDLPPESGMPSRASARRSPAGAARRRKSGSGIVNDA